jgi:hypothetical protein
MKGVPQAESILLFGFALNSRGGLISEAETIER